MGEAQHQRVQWTPNSSTSFWLKLQVWLVKSLHFFARTVSLWCVLHHSWHGKAASTKPVTQTCWSLQWMLCREDEMTNPNEPSRAISWQGKRQGQPASAQRAMWKLGDLCTTCKALCKAVRQERLCAYTVTSAVAHPYSCVSECIALSSENTKCLLLQ